MDVAAEVIAGVRAQMGDLAGRLIATLRRLSAEDLSWRPNPESNSVANLVTHVCGNLRQRFHAGLGGAPDDRERDREFSCTGPWTVDELVTLVERTFERVDATTASLSALDLGRERIIQGRRVTGLAVLLMATSHAAEHVGQVVYIAKARLGEHFASLSIPRPGR